MYTTIRKATKSRFGKMATTLLADGQIIARKDRRIMIHGDNGKQQYKHDDGYYWYPAADKRDKEYQWFSLITGESSGMMVLDADNQEGIDYLEYLGLERSYSTSSENHPVGAHFYLPYEPMSLDLPSGIDFITNGVVVHFHSPGKSKGEVVLNDPALLEAIRTSGASHRAEIPLLPPSSNMSNTYESTSMSDLLCVTSYEWSSMSVYSYVEDKGIGRWSWGKDVEDKCNREISRMKRVSEGKRKTTLSNIAFNMVRIGGEHRLEDLKEAAVKTGLSEAEAQDTVDYALANYDNERARTLDERVMFWATRVKGNIRAGRKKVQHDLIDAIAARAMWRHDYDPPVNILRLSGVTGIGRGTINGLRDELVRQGFLKVVKANKPKCPDNFYLCINGIELDKLGAEIDALLNDKTIELEWTEGEFEFHPSQMDFSGERSDDWMVSISEAEPHLPANHSVQPHIPASQFDLEQPEIAGEGKGGHIDTNSPEIYEWDEAQTQTKVVPNDDELSIEPTVEMSVSNDPAVEWWNYIVSQKPETQHLIDVDQNERAAHFDDELISGTLHNLTNDPIYRTKVNEWKAALINTLDNDKMMEYRTTLKAANRPGEIEEIFLIPERELLW